MCLKYWSTTNIIYVQQLPGTMREQFCNLELCTENSVFVYIIINEMYNIHLKGKTLKRHVIYGINRQA